ncbi:MAG: ParA family protein [Azospirillaceae bacterium]|nr:ParA family protein [Azospirillaceae bacterium]
MGEIPLASARPAAVDDASILDRPPDPAPPNRPRYKKVLLTASPKGGSGKTTFVKNVAVIAAHNGLSVAVIDFDRQKTLSKWWARRPETMPRIEHYEAPLNGAHEIGELDDYDLLVIDTPPGIEDHPAEMLALLQVADLIIVPTRPGWDDRESVIPFMRYLRDRHAKAAFLLNATQKGTKLLDEARRSLLAVGPLCPIDIRQFIDITTTSPLGLGVIEVRGASGGDDFVSVWHFIRNELGL